MVTATTGRIDSLQQVVGDPLDLILEISAAIYVTQSLLDLRLRQLTRGRRIEQVVLLHIEVFQLRSLLDEIEIAVRGIADVQLHPGAEVVAILAAVASGRAMDDHASDGA